MLPLARDRAARMVANGLYSRFGLNDEKRIAKALLGCLGELAFETLLQQEGIAYQLDNSDFQTKNSDEFDFLIKNKKLDVKVAKKSTQAMPNDRWTYGYPQQQRPDTKDFVVVGWIDFSNESVGFYGWIRGQRVSEFPVVTRNSYRGYRYLTPNHEFQWGELNQDLEQLLWGEM
ncbi:MAG: hypothetical protein AB8G22_25575 [Saprospiraceae bacterium]